MKTMARVGQIVRVDYGPSLIEILGWDSEGNVHAMIWDELENNIEVGAIVTQ
jgi:hypothetical protein